MIPTNHTQSPISITREQETYYESDSSVGIYTDDDQYEFDESLTNYSGTQNPLLQRSYLDHNHGTDSEEENINPTENHESNHIWARGRLPDEWKIIRDSHGRQYYYYTYVDPDSS